MAAKASKDEVLRRVRSVVKWMMEGHRSKDIIPNIVSLWNLKSTRQAQTYIAKAYEFMLDNVTDDVKKQLAFHENTRFERIRELIKKQKTLSTDTGLSSVDKHKLYISYEKMIEDIFFGIEKLKGLHVTRIANADGSNIQTPSQLTFKIN